MAGAKRPTPLSSGSGLAGGAPRASAASSSRDVLQASSLAERRQNWAKMGVVALRDLALEEVPPTCFEGLASVKGADLSLVGRAVCFDGCVGGWLAPSSPCSHAAAWAAHRGCGGDR